MKCVVNNIANFSIVLFGIESVFYRSVTHLDRVKKSKVKYIKKKIFFSIFNKFVENGTVRESLY